MVRCGMNLFFCLLWGFFLLLQDGGKADLGKVVPILQLFTTSKLQACRDTETDSPAT